MCNKHKVYWRGFQPPDRVTPIVDHPDKVWGCIDDNSTAIERGWKLLKVDHEGTPIKMIGCLGGCGGTAPQWNFTQEIVKVDSWLMYETQYTCKTCGGKGTEQDYNFSENLYSEFNELDGRYKQAKAEAEAAWREMTEIADRLNEDWNRTLTVEDYRV